MTTRKAVYILICFAVVLGCLMLTIPRASAAEPDVDFDDHKAWCDRLMKANLDVVFATSEYVDGATAQMLGYILQSRFAEDPFGFAEALSLESVRIQERVFLLFNYDAEYFPYLLTIANLIDPEEMEDPAARQVMIRLRNEIWAAFDGENPGTGDPVGIFAALMAVSGIAAAALFLGRRKTA